MINVGKMLILRGIKLHKIHGVMTHLIYWSNFKLHVFMHKIILIIFDSKAINIIDMINNQ